MKTKLIAIFALVSGALTMNSCAEFLDVVPEGTPSEQTYFATDKDAEDAIDAVYWIFGEGDGMWGRDLFWEQGCGDDCVYTKSRWSSLETLQFTGEESPISDSWEYLYKYISYAQWIVSSLLEKGEENLSPVESRVLGEAYFMRAFLHFHVAYRHGTKDLGVPFERWEDFPGGYNNEVYKQQASVEDNYALIISDLEQAARLLPLFETYTSADYGRAHRAAAWALMVKVYAYWAYWDSSKWALIPDLVDKIENEGGRGLLPDCADPFKIENNWSKEYIWSVNSIGGTNPGGSEFPGVCLRNTGWGYYNGWGSVKPTHDLYLEYQKHPGDKRLQLNLIGYQDEINTFTFFGNKAMKYSENGGDAVLSGYSVAKYMEPYTYGNEVFDSEGQLDPTATALTNPHISTNGDFPTTDLNVPLIRFAEMVLFKAEALLMQGKSGAAAELNRLTKRAGLGEIYQEGSVTMADLKHERRCELAFEFTDRFQDLKRWNETAILSSKLKGNVPDVAGQSEGVKCTVKDIWPVGDATRSYSAANQLVFPYPPQEIVKAGGKWKQPLNY